MLWSGRLSAPSASKALAWLALCAAIAAAAALRGREAQIGALVPESHRVVTDETYLLLRLGGEAADDVLDAAVAALDGAAERCPLAPPPAEARRWLDGHVLSLLPREHHAALAARLAPAALREAIAAARARLSSPFAGLVGDDLRRDPLRLRELGQPGVAGRLGFLAAADAGGPDVSPRGDLVAVDGRAELLCFRTGPSAQGLEDSLRERLAGLPVETSLVGAPARDDAARAAIDAAPRVLAGLAAALTLVLALALRRVRPVLALLLAVLGPAALLAVVVAPLGVLDVPLLVLAVGIAAAPARPDRTVTALTALALLPLLLVPYPAWHGWAPAWALGLVAAGLARRAVQPLLLTCLGGQPHELAPLGAEGPPPLRLRADLPLAVACAGLLAAGAWSFEHVRFDSPNPLPLAAPGLAAAEAEVRAAFFDPDDVAVVDHPGDAPEAALARAADDLPALLTLVPGHASRLDAPGAFAVAGPELAARQEALQALDLSGRLELLRATIADLGMRPDAFGEFIRGAEADLDEPPSPEAALAGALGPWLAGHRDARGALTTRLYLSPGSAAPPTVAAADGRPLAPRGPGVFARDERDRASSRAGLVAAAGAWLSAFIVWLATRRLALALSLALAAITAQCALLFALQLLGLPFGPLGLPVLLLAGAAAAVAGLRAVRALAAGRPLLDPGRLANALGPLAAVLALLTAPEPIWRELGLTTALAILAAHGVGGLAAPSLYALLGRAADRTSPPST